SLAGFATPSLDVEAEAPRFVASDPGLGKHREQFPDVSKQTCISGRVGSRRAPDGGLIDFCDLFGGRKPENFTMGAGIGQSSIQFPRKSLIQDILDQRGLARTRDSGHADEQTEREFGGDVFEVIVSGAFDYKTFAVAGATGLRRLDS